MKPRHYHLQIGKKIIIIGMINLLMLSFFVSYVRSEPITLTVDIKGNGDYQSIQKAINAANPGDTITVSPGIYYERIVVDKAIFLRGTNSTNTIIDGDGSGNVTTIRANDVEMSGFTLRNSTMNISNISSLTAGCIISGKNISLSDCRIIDCTYGLRIENTSNIDITTCTVFGVSLGIHLFNCSDITLTTIDITGSLTYGITLRQCNNNTLSRCVISDSFEVGLVVSSSSWNLISDSEFVNNSIGVTIAQSHPLIRSVHNILVSNNFIGNRIQHAYDANNNSWDNGAMGNYWDDYAGTDSNNDGIGDTSVFIPLVSTDAYPSMNPIAFEETSALTLQVISLADNAVVNGLILIEGTATAGNQEVVAVKIKIDNETEQIAEGTTHWQTMVNTSQYADGAHVIKITAVTEDSQTQSRSLSFTINNNIDGQEKETPGFSLVLFIACLLMYGLYRHRK